MKEEKRLVPQDNGARCPPWLIRGARMDLTFAEKTVMTTKENLDKIKDRIGVLEVRSGLPDDKGNETFVLALFIGGLSRESVFRLFNDVKETDPNSVIGADPLRLKREADKSKVIDVETVICPWCKTKVEVKPDGSAKCPKCGASRTPKGTKKNLGKLRTPENGFCWRDRRHKCYHGKDVAVFCANYSGTPLTCPETAELYKREKGAK